MAVSLLGDGVFIVAVAWQAYAIADRPSALAYVGLAASLPQVVMLLIGGAVSDRIPRRTVLFWADVARLVAVGALAALAIAGDLRLWELYLVSALIGTATAFASPALDALVPQLVPEGELIQANAVEQFVRPAAVQLAGPALGGLAVATMGPKGAFSFDALTFAFSAVCVRRMTRLPGRSVDDSRVSLRHDVWEGLRYVRGHVWLWGTFVSATFTYLLFIGPTQVLLPYLVRNGLHQGAFTYGAVLAVGGVGALVGAVMMGRARQPRRPVTWVYAWWTVATLAVAGYGLATHAWGLALAALVVNGGEAVGAVVWGTLKQRRVANSMLGRVSSIDWFVSTALLPLSYALTAPVAHALGARTTLFLAGTVGAAVTLGFLFVPGMRDGERSEEPRSADVVPVGDVSDDVADDLSADDGGSATTSPGSTAGAMDPRPAVIGPLPFDLCMASLYQRLDDLERDLEIRITAAVAELRAVQLVQRPGATPLATDRR
jgi:MFS family permease